MMVQVSQCIFALSLTVAVHAFVPHQINSIKHGSSMLQETSSSSFDNDEFSKNVMAPSSQQSRRGFVATSSLAACHLLAYPSKALAIYKPAVRPVCYRVDSTIPPTILSFSTGQGEGILSGLGRGSGTDKDAIVVDSVNLNNMLNKAVFGAIGTVSSLTDKNLEKSKSWDTSFCCLAIPSNPQVDDVSLAQKLLQSMVNARKGGQSTGLGLHFCPYSTQPFLKSYISGEINESKLAEVLTDAGVSRATQELYFPLVRYAKSKSIDLIAMAPEVEDMVTVRSQGLQYVNEDRRSHYVMDFAGFVALPNDPRFKLYTDRSLIKDYIPQNEKDSFANYFSERIMAHEAGATALAQYAVERPGSFVAALAPISDLRYLGGINGRLPRVCRALKPDSVVTENAVTTILINPTAVDTLSKSRHLRLEIGTGPDTLQYQTKVADYLWFSSTPKVNLIPRLMN